MLDLNLIKESNFIYLVTKMFTISKRNYRHYDIRYLSITKSNITAIAITWATILAK